MTVPDFQTLMLPFLSLHADGEDHTMPALRAALAEEFRLVPADLEERLNSGTRRFDNRVAWANVYLSRAGLIAKPRRGVSHITERGQAVLARNLDRVDIRMLHEFEEFREFRSRSGETRTSEAVVEPLQVTATPEEAMDRAWNELQAGLAEELLDRVASQAPVFFEHLVLRVLEAMGYGASVDAAVTHLGRTSNDEGLDGSIAQDRLGLDAVYVQAKKWARDRSVGRPEIQAFVGALHGAQATKGVFITTARFSREAQDYVRNIGNVRVVLIDGRQLAELMVNYGVGVTVERTFELKRLDEDFFAEELPPSAP